MEGLSKRARVGPAREQEVADPQVSSPIDGDDQHGSLDEALRPSSRLVWPMSAFRSAAAEAKASRTAAAAAAAASSPPSSSSASSCSESDSSSPSSLKSTTAKTTKTTTRPRLLTWDQVPSWYAQTNLIRTGFRPVTGSARLCFESLGYLHNESVNIYSHLIPGLIFFGAACYFLDAFLFTPDRFPHAAASDVLMIRVFSTTSAVCFGVSASYHALVCHSRRVAERWVRFDYAAIVLQIWGSFLSGLYMCFYCEPGLRNGYWTMITTLSVITALVVLDARLQSLQWRMLRLGAFVATGLSAFAPIAHAIAIFPYDQLVRQSGLRYYYLEGVFILLGAVIYATHFPESARPARFDIWGASHQIFHVLVVLGALAHLCGITSAFEWNYEHSRCPAAVS